MKKILTHLTGIVFLITILVAGGCSPEGNNGALTKGPKKVTIKLKVKKRNGKKHLKMYDSNKPDNKVVDSLETLVMPGDTVVWEPRRFLGRIKKIEKIGPESEGDIINIDAEQIPGTNNFRLIIPNDAPIPSEREKYDIIFKDRHDSTHTIDPYLRIPPPT